MNYIYNVTELFYTITKNQLLKNNLKKILGGYDITFSISMEQEARYARMTSQDKGTRIYNRHNCMYLIASIPVFCMQSGRK